MGEIDSILKIPVSYWLAVLESSALYKKGKYTISANQGQAVLTIVSFFKVGQVIFSNSFGSIADKDESDRRGNIVYSVTSLTDEELKTINAARWPDERLRLSLFIVSSIRVIERGQLYGIRARRIGNSSKDNGGGIELVDFCTGNKLRALQQGINNFVDEVYLLCQLDNKGRQ